MGNIPLVWRVLHGLTACATGLLQKALQWGLGMDCKTEKAKQLWNETSHGFAIGAFQPIKRR